MHIWRSERSGLGSGVVRDCLGGSGLPLDMTGVCLGPLGCHGYDNSGSMHHSQATPVLGCYEMWGPCMLVQVFPVLFNVILHTPVLVSTTRTWFSSMP